MARRLNIIFELESKFVLNVENGMVEPIIIQELQKISWNCVRLDEMI
jgi:hypothetical protein